MKHPCTDNLAMLKECNVVVVGAGPAGSAAAYHLAAAGIGTLLVDRECFPRSKVCGDGLGPRAVQALRHMGVVVPAGGDMRIEGVRLTTPRGSRIVSFEDRDPACPIGAVVPRRVLDARIRNAAEAAEAIVVDGCTAVGFQTAKSGRIEGLWLEREGERHLVRAPTAVLADGARGSLSRELRYNRCDAPTSVTVGVRQYVVGLSDLTPHFEIHAPLRWGTQTLYGYAWVFPLAGGAANVGVGFERTGAAGFPPLLAVLRKFLGDLQAHDPRFARAEPVASPEVGVLSTRMSDPLVRHAGVIVVGDAAGLTNPMSSEGIAAALESGELAAAAVIRAHRRGDSPNRRYRHRLIKAYPTQWRGRHASYDLRLLVHIGDLGSSTSKASNIEAAFWDLLLSRGRWEPCRAAWPTAIGGATRRLALLTAARIRSVSHQLEPILGEILRGLFTRPHLATVLPIALGAAIAGPRGARAPFFRDGVAAISLFALTHLAHEDVSESVPRQDQPAPVAAVLVGDRALAQATILLSKLPDDLYREIVTILRRGAEVSLGGREAAAYIGAIGGFAEAVTTLATHARQLPPTQCRSYIQFTRWFSRTAILLRESRRTPSDDHTRQLSAQLALVPDVAALDNPELRAMGKSLCEEVLATLAPRAVAQSSEVVV